MSIVGHGSALVALVDLDCWFARNLYRGRAVARGMCPVTREAVMKSKVLDETLSLITKVFSDPSVEPGHKDQLRQAKRELEKMARGGKLQEERVFLIVEIVAKVLLEIVKTEAGFRPE
jgi:hypothetical protein